MLPYHWIPDQEGPRGWGLGHSRFQPEDLELTLCDVAHPGRLHFGLGRDRPHFWLCFGFDATFLADGGALVASYYRGDEGDGGTITKNYTRGIHPILGGG